MFIVSAGLHYVSPVRGGTFDISLLTELERWVYAVAINIPLRWSELLGWPLMSIASFHSDGEFLQLMLLTSSKLCAEAKLIAAAKLHLDRMRQRGYGIPQAVYERILRDVGEL